MPYTSDIGEIKKVIACKPSGEMEMIFPLSSEDIPMVGMSVQGKGFADEHGAFVRMLEASGARVFDFKDLLNESIARLGKDGMHEWFRYNCPFVCDALSAVDVPVDADLLLGRKKEYFYVRQDGKFDPYFMPQKDICYVRDIAAMTPRGLVFANFCQYSRMFQQRLARLAVENTLDMTDIEIAPLDFENEGTFFQGGDLIVLDENTVMLGVNNSTEPKAARLLAERLELNVVAVDLPFVNFEDGGMSAYLPLNQAIAHLDTILTLTGPVSAAVLPFLLEAGWAEDNPLLDLLDLIEREVQRSSCYYRYRRKDVFEVERQANRAQFKQIGWVTLYEKGTGRKQDLDCKIVDYLRQTRRVEPVFAGFGDSAGDPLSVLHDMRNQGINTFALSPGRVAVFNEAGNIIKKLENTGIKVERLTSAYLSRWNGGPHCLTLPLERKEL